MGSPEEEIIWFALEVILSNSLCNLQKQVSEQFELEESDGGLGGN